MLNNENKTSFNKNENNLEVPVVNFPFNKQPPNKHKEWITISGIATSQVWSKSSTDTPAYIFLRPNDNKHSLKDCVNSKCKRCEIPVIFRIKKDYQFIKPNLNKGDNLTLSGYFADTHKPRPSFTCYSYQVKHERSLWAFNKDHE